MWRSLVARLLWEQDVAGSNPVVPTICGCGSMVELKPSKLLTRVRFPSPAPLKRQVRALCALAFLFVPQNVRQMCAKLENFSKTSVIFGLRTVATVGTVSLLPSPVISIFGLKYLPWGGGQGRRPGLRDFPCLSRGRRAAYGARKAARGRLRRMRSALNGSRAAAPPLPSMGERGAGPSGLGIGRGSWLRARCARNGRRVLLLGKAGANAFVQSIG